MIDSALPHPVALVLDFESDPCVHYALQQHQVPVVKRLRVTNTGAADVVGVEVEVTLGAGSVGPWRQRIDTLRAGTTHNFEVVELALDADLLRRHTERVDTMLSARVVRGADVLARIDRQVELFPLREWPGLRSLPELLAAFVLPNDPVVADLLQRAAVHLRVATGSGALDGYQTRSPDRVTAITAALHRALTELTIGYANPPASFEQQGQKVRLPDEIARHRQATCLDLVLFFVAALEQVGLHPLVILVEGHAFAGVWRTDETFQEAAVEDGLRLRKRVDLEEILVIEPTLATADSAAVFPQAVAQARRRLADLGPFRCAIDVARARRLGIKPLPGVAAHAPAAAALPVGSAPTMERGPAEPAIPAPSPAETAAVADSPATRLDRWQRRLLDLSLRNRLINFRETKLALRLMAPDLGVLEDALAGGGAFAVRPRPELADPKRGRDAARAAATGDDLLGRFLVEELGSRRLYTGLEADALDARLLELWRHARLALEESGANVVYLALGTLLWCEPGAGTEIRRAPILLIPLAIERASAREPCKIRIADEDARVNTTLLEKLRTEFKVDTTGLDDLSEDESGLDVKAILARFRRAVVNQDRWDVADEAWIAPFSFTKFLMWLDLRERADALLSSPVLRHLTQAPGTPFEPDASFPEPDALDATVAPLDAPCPLDSDSSQLAAALAAADGRSFVLEGPPGTGKSQTITNLIATALARGKRVLFVAEKMAALDVVRRRLETVGLGAFCLELHSNQTSKRRVLDRIAEPLDLVAQREPEGWEQLAAHLEEVRARLNAYVRTIHTPRPLGESVFEVTSRLVGLQAAPRVELGLADPGNLDAVWASTRRAGVDALATAAAPLGAVEAHPLRAMRRARWEAALPDQTAAAVRSALGACAALGQAAAVVRGVLGVDLAELARVPFAEVVALARAVLVTPGAADALLTEPGFEGLRPRLRAHVEAVRQKDELRDRVREAFADGVLELPLEERLVQLRTGMASFWPLSWWRCGGVRKTLRGFAKGGHLASNEELAHRLELAIDLRRRLAALGATEHEAARVFGPHLWNGGDPGGRDGVARLERAIAWAEEVRGLLLRLGDAAFVATLRARVIALSGVERDTLATGVPAGDALRELVERDAGFAAARAGLQELLELHDATAWTPPVVGAPWLAHCQQQLSTWRDQQRELIREWCAWRQYAVRATELDLGALVAAVERGEVVADDIGPAFERNFRHAWLVAVSDADPLLSDFERSQHERLIERFGDLDRKMIETARGLVAARLAARVPKMTGSAAAGSEVGILRRELAKKTRHWPLRRLFDEIPNLLPLLKPCFLMSPLSVAQYLAAGGQPFDIVVFDEASQITVWDAVGAIARGRSCVVVGDSRQLPPTSFFQRVEGGDDEVDEGQVEDLESILDECGAAGLRRLRLRWHYRSRHESLITFSNWHYYDNQLFTFPTADDRAGRLGVSLVAVADGVYDRAHTRTNEREARSVVDDLLARLRAPGAPGDQPTVGIVTFSQAQQLLIETMLDAARRADPGLEPFFSSDLREPVFVKNLENVQGDERDVILFSVCYGPDSAGKVAMSFGPLNMSGGERRLNVAITRAREQVVVHSTLRADQIDLTRTNATGVKHLKSFLEYAARGPSSLGEALQVGGAAHFESPMEAEIATALRARGHTVVAQVGCSGYRVDLAVQDPDTAGRFLLGIECDGANYHSAKTARDRDRLRPEVLARLGWRLLRVWSTDWLRSPERELRRIEVALASAPAATVPPQPPTPQSPEPQSPEPQSAEPASQPPRPPRLAASPAAVPAATQPVATEPVGASLPEGALLYRCAEVSGGVAFEEANPSDLHRAVQVVLDLEAPIHIDVLCRRLAAAFSISRVTARARERILEAALTLPLQAHRPREHGSFLWPPRLDPSSWTGYRVPDPDDASTQRDAEAIPGEEIANAAVAVVGAQIGIGREDLARETARVLGFARMGSRVQEAMSGGIDLALAAQRLVENDSHLTLPRT